MKKSKLHELVFREDIQVGMYGDRRAYSLENDKGCQRTSRTCSWRLCLSGDSFVYGPMIVFSILTCMHAHWPQRTFEDDTMSMVPASGITIMTDSGMKM